jgi:hypothetical protein
MCDTGAASWLSQRNETLPLGRLPRKQVIGLFYDLRHVGSIGWSSISIAALVDTVTDLRQVKSALSFIDKQR